MAFICWISCSKETMKPTKQEPLPKLTHTSLINNDNQTDMWGWLIICWILMIMTLDIRRVKHQESKTNTHFTSIPV